MMEEERISFLLNSLVREMNSQADGLLRKEFGITYSQFIFLVKILEAPELDVTRLAERLGVTKGAVSKRLAWFVEREFARSYQLPGDSKRVMISLTTRGEQMARLAGDYLEQAFLATLSQSSDIDFGQFGDDIRAVTRLFLAQSLRES
jgi:DNA-binding MarR family transcriptional regulator